MLNEQLYSPELEEALLSAVLIESELLHDVFDILDENDFYIERYRIIFKAVFDCYVVNPQFDMLLLADKLAERGKLDEIGGAFYLTQLLGIDSHDVNAKEYALKIKNLSQRRQAVQNLGNLAKITYDLTDSSFADIAPLLGITPVERPVFKGLNLSELWSVPNNESLINGLVCKGDIAMIFGAPSAGKSFVVLDLLTECAIGGKFANRFAVNRPLKVIYATGEGQSSIGKRLRASVNARLGSTHIELAKQNITTFLTVPQLGDKESPTTIDRFVRQIKSELGQIDLFVLDTFNQASEGFDENFARDVTILLGNFKRACLAMGCVGILVHHTNKQGGYRGSTALHGAFDLMLEVKGDSSGRYLECFKIKDSPTDGGIKQGEQFYFEIKADLVADSCFVYWQPDTFKPDKTEQRALTAKEQAKQNILDLLTVNGKLSTQAIVENVMRVGRNSVMQALKELESLGQVTVELGADGRSKFYQLNLSLGS